MPKTYLSMEHQAATHKRCAITMHQMILHVSHFHMVFEVADWAAGRGRVVLRASSILSREGFILQRCACQKRFTTYSPDALMLCRHNFPPWARNMKEINPDDAARWGSDKSIVTDWEIDPKWPNVDK